jgi:hypothetical protein
LSFFTARPSQPQQQKNRGWGQQISEQDRAGIPRCEIAGGDDVTEVTNARTDKEHASTKLVASRASNERNAAYNPAKPIPRLATPTSNWKGLVGHPIA